MFIEESLRTGSRFDFHSLATPSLNFAHWFQVDRPLKFNYPLKYSRIQFERFILSSNKNIHQITLRVVLVLEFHHLFDTNSFKIQNIFKETKHFSSPLKSLYRMAKTNTERQKLYRMNMSKDKSKHEGREKKDSNS